MDLVHEFDMQEMKRLNKSKCRHVQSGGAVLMNVRAGDMTSNGTYSACTYAR